MTDEQKEKWRVLDRARRKANRIAEAAARQDNTDLAVSARRLARRAKWKQKVLESGHAGSFGPGAFVLLLVACMLGGLLFNFLAS